VTDETVSISEASLDILWFQPRIAPEEGLVRITGGQHAKNMFHSKPATSNDRLPTENLRVHRDAFEKELLIHSDLT
jgi:hypothetical protein